MPKRKNTKLTVSHTGVTSPNSLQKIEAHGSESLAEVSFQDIIKPEYPVIVQESKISTNWKALLQVFVVVIIPFCSAIVYFGFIASDRYVSNTQIVIQSAEMGTSTGIAGLLGAASALGGNSGAGSQGDILVSYIHSSDILDELERLLSLKNIFSPDFVDSLSILAYNTSSENFLEYYRNKVLVEWDPSTSLLFVEVEAFTPNDAKLILDTIIMLSEEKLNSLSDRKQKDRVAFAKEELQLAETRLSKARLTVADFRRRYGEIDPIQSAHATGSLLASIQAELAQERMELSALLYVMKPDSPGAQSIRSKIRALEKQIEMEKSRTTSSDAKNVVLSDLVTEFEGLRIEEEFSRAIYTSALSFFENTRAQAQQDSSYVVDFIPANLPQEALQPKRIQIILSVLVVSLLILGIGKLIVAAIREQARL